MPSARQTAKPRPAKPRKLVLRTFDAARYLKAPETRAAYLDEAFKSNDIPEIVEALGTIARAVGMSKVARSAKVSRERLAQVLSRNGTPDLNTVIGVLRACGVLLVAKAR